MQLNLNRVGLLLRRMAILQGPRVLGICFLLLLLPLMASPTGDSYDGGFFYEKWFWIVLPIVGAGVTIYSLPELRDADGRQAFLTLPASDAEKWFATWLFTGPILVTAVVPLYYLFALLLNPLLNSYGFEYKPFPLIGSGGAFSCIRAYLLLMHPTLLLGAIVFNRSPAVKTVLSGVVAFLGLSVVLALTIRIVYADQITGLFSVHGNFSMSLFDDTDASVTLAWITGTLLSLALLAASYFKFQEKEV